MADYLDLVLPITKDNLATPYFEDYLFKIVQGFGGEGSNTIETSIVNSESAASIAWVQGFTNRLAKRVEELENDLSSYRNAHKITQLQVDTAGYTAKTKNVNYDARHNDWVEATQGAIITLPKNPIKNHRVRVSIGDSSVIKVLSLLSNIKIRGSLTNSVLFRTAGESFDFHYFGDYWLIS